MSSTPGSAAANINWRHEAASEFGQTITDAHVKLSGALMEDVRPEDLQIGGHKVRDCLSDGDWFWRDFDVTAEVTLEHWYAYNGTIVRLSKMRADKETSSQASILAEQLKDGSNKRRTARIAALAGATALLTIDVFDAPKEMTDDTFSAMRQAAAIHADEAGFRKKLAIDERSATHITTPQVEAYIRHRTITHGGNPTPADLTRYGQTIVDQKIDELAVLSASLQAIVGLVQNGTRILPSKPQHLISV